MLSIFKETTAHTFMLAFSAPLCVHNLFYPLFRVTQAYDHMTSHPWGLLNSIFSSFFIFFV